MAAEEHLVSVGWGDKLQLLGAFAEEEPITSQCSAIQCRLVHLQCSAVQCSTVPCLCREGAGGDRNTISIFFMNCLSALHCLACTIVCLLQSLFCILVLYFHPLIFQTERRGFYFSRINQWPVHPYTSVECLSACVSATLQYTLKQILSAGFAIG